MARRRRHTRLLAILLATLTLPLVLWGLSPLPSQGAGGAGALQQQVQQQRAKERSLSSAAARLGQLERLAARDVALLQQRLSSAQADLSSWQARLARTQTNLLAARRHLMRLRVRLKRDRTVLASVLLGAYQAGKPDLIDVVLGAHGFADLLDRADFLRTVQRRNAQIVGNVRSVRNATHGQETALAMLLPRQQAATAAVQRERDALAQVGVALRAREAALAQARAARLAALQNTVSSRRRAERELTRLLAERQRAAAQVGPGGPWAIPWPIVQCESGGQNLPPNSAGASGYYQFLPSTWRGLGGSTPNAFQAPKAEQDRLAATLWNGGAGAGNWVCAGLVGIH
ncbi:MAG TPA: transglycosylase family protein [Solirubrobacteraceae bacterium]